MSKPRRSPLHQVHVDEGAVLTPFAGWDLPLRYTSETAEHVAVRSAAGLFDLSHMAQLWVTGPAATAALDLAVASDITVVKSGRAKYTLMCDESGAVVDDLIVYRLGPERLFVIANAVNAAAVHDGISAAGHGLDATVVTGCDALIAVQGPQAEQIMAAVADDPAVIAAVRPYGCTSTVVAGVAAFVARTGYTGEDGFEVAVAADRGPHAWRAIRAAGAGYGLIPAGLACRDSLRLEAGMALYGHELSRDIDPFEAGLGRVVALTKAAFAGRDALEVAASQVPGRVLVGVVADGRRILRQGQGLRAADPATELDPAGDSGHDADGAAEVPGTVTSGAWSPTLERSIAMAYVAPSLSRVGTKMVAEVRGTTVTATVVDLPFYRRPTTTQAPSPISSPTADPDHGAAT